MSPSFRRSIVNLIRTTNIIRIPSDLPTTAACFVAARQLPLKYNSINWHVSENTVVIIALACRCKIGFGTTAAVDMSQKKSEILAHGAKKYSQMPTGAVGSL
jgi:hypothetical protein